MIWIRSNSLTGEHYKYDDGLPYPPAVCLCPCCGFKTLTRRNWHEVCPVCYWEDDGHDEQNADEHSSWNHSLTLKKGRHNFLKFGACRKKMIRWVRGPSLKERDGAKSYKGTPPTAPE